MNGGIDCVLPMGGVLVAAKCPHTAEMLRKKRAFDLEAQSLAYHTLRQRSVFVFGQHFRANSFRFGSILQRAVSGQQVTARALFALIHVGEDADTIAIELIILDETHVRENDFESPAVDGRKSLLASRPSCNIEPKA